MIDYGGCAFPINGGYNENQDNEMSLRDYFAVRDMEAIITKGMEDTKREVNGVGFIVEYAYEYADAMIKQRNKQGV